MATWILIKQDRGFMQPFHLYSFSQQNSNYPQKTLFFLNLISIDKKRKICYKININQCQPINTMTQTSGKRTPRRGRLFPEYTIPPEELARRKAERDAFGKRCRVIFDRVCPELIKEHYNWFIIIEPESEDYFIDLDEEKAAQKATEKYPNRKLCTFRLNETGACGRI